MDASFHNQPLPRSPRSTDAHEAYRRRLMWSAYGRQRDATADAQAVITRERAGMLLKLRLLFGIPYHEWAEAQGRYPTATSDLIDEYFPKKSATRCPPWATRNYRSPARLPVPVLPRPTPPTPCAALA